MDPEQIPDRLFSADGLGRAQRSGGACASCGKRWPRPRLPIGRLVDGAVLYVCDDCTPGWEIIEDGPDPSPT
ncbi:hypothetical protein EDD29_0236 [Actinocorallia herbida]|uniref:Uncharacterized protein n=1 Tax=Actinocorallia herbida TaxID=58109 RepID=A0A3N1CN94_9ACTN|nr:hypothetical protein [Actinocorallia herbida]ROO82753.1 hypothetical protein EDD29_0236 [Actinocorallia herbida]